MRKSLALWVAPLLLALVLLAPVVAGAGVNVVEVKDGYTKTVNASDTVDFQWAVYNNDTSPYLIEVHAFLPENVSDVTVTTNEDFLNLNSGESSVIIATVATTKDAPSQPNINITLNIAITKLSDPSQVTEVTETAHVSVKAMFESTGNKIFGIWENQLPAPFNALMWSFIITVLLWIVIAAIIYFVIDPLVHQFTKKTKTELDDRLLEVTRGPIFILIVMFGLVDSLAILNIPTEWHRQIWQIYQIALIMNIAWIAYRIFDKIVIYYAEKWAKNSETEIDDVLVPLLQKLGVVIIPVVGIFAILGQVGVDVTLLVASMGVIGIIIGYAAQDTLSNFFAGMQLLMDRPFKIGDIIELDSGEICEVQKVGLRSTQVYNTADHETIILPNNEVCNKKVVNYSRPDMHRSMNAEVGVAYGTDVEKVKKILLEVANSHPDVIKQEGQMPYVRLSKFNDSSVDFKLWYWVEIKKMWRVASEIRQNIYDRFNQEGIEIPFPQSVVTFKNDPSPGKK